MLTSVKTPKTTSILDIIASNADVFTTLTSNNHYNGSRDICKRKVASVLVNPDGKIVSLILSNTTGGVTTDTTLTYVPTNNVFASIEDILNDNPICNYVDRQYLIDRFGINRPIYALNDKNKIYQVIFGSYISCINLITGEITYKYGSMDYFFFSQEELKASRPDIFPRKAKVKVTKEYILSVNEDELEDFKSEVHDIDLEPLTDDKNYSVERID